MPLSLSRRLAAEGRLMAHLRLKKHAGVPFTPRFCVSKLNSREKEEYVMMHSIFKGLDSLVGFETASAHCDIPCKIYDPSTAQIAALSVIRFLDLINEMAGKDSLSLAEQASLSRLVREKEIHAAQVKDEVRVIWGDYFKQPQFETFPDTHALVHSIMLAASACKQHVDQANGDKLLALVNEFAASFWATKGVDTFTATCPYPPSKEVVYPKLG